MNPTALPPALFERQDGAPDGAFYAVPRLVQHLDPQPLAALTGFYRTLLHPGSDVLDLMSSWVSHLPPELRLGEVAGLGMNGVELIANARLTQRVVRDLNRDAILPWPDGSFDAVLNALSIQYLTQPLAVYAEVARVLRPGGVAVIALSHRCFPTKAVRAFRDFPPADRVRLCQQYFALAGGFAAAQLTDLSVPGSDPLWLVHARRQ